MSDVGDRLSELLRQLGEAREEIKFRDDACAAILKEDERLRGSNAELRGVLERADEMCRIALPSFDWRKSPLTADAIRLLNEVPSAIRTALASSDGGRDAISDEARAGAP